MAGTATTGTAAANLETLKRGYEAFQTGNLDLLRDEIFAPDIVWHGPGRNQLSGDYHGVEAVLGLFVKQFELTDGKFSVEVHDFLASDEHAVAIATVSAERNGKAMTDMYTHVGHFRDGRITESWILDFDPYKADELFG